MALRVAMELISGGPSLARASLSGGVTGGRIPNIAPPRAARRPLDRPQLPARGPHDETHAVPVASRLVAVQRPRRRGREPAAAGEHQLEAAAVEARDELDLLP